MLSLLRYFLMSMGVLFLFLLAGVWYVWHANVWNVQALGPVLLPGDIPGWTATSTDAEAGAQAVWLESVGLEPGGLSDLSEATRVCFVDQLGEERVQEIEAGALPNPLEITKGLGCIE